MNSVSFLCKYFLCLECGCKIPTYHSLEPDKIFNCAIHGFGWFHLTFNGEMDRLFNFFYLA